MARYHQHLHELLEMDLSPLDYMLKMFPDFKDRDGMRKVCVLPLPISKFKLRIFYQKPDVYRVSQKKVGIRTF